MVARPQAAATANISSMTIGRTSTSRRCITDTTTGGLRALPDALGRARPAPPRQLQAADSD